MSHTEEDNVGNGLQRSPHHFHVGGNLYVQAESVLFKVYKELFLRRSAPMSNLISELVPNEHGLPGTAEHNPLRVPDSAPEFTLLMNAMFGDPSEGVEIDEYKEPPSPSLSRSFMMLRVSTRWALEPLRLLALYQIDTLKKQGKVKPVPLMMVAAECSVRYLYYPAVEELLRTPELILTASDMEVLDDCTLQLLLMWRDTIDKERINTIINFPGPPRNVGCRRQALCTDAAVACWEDLEDFARHPLADFAVDLVYRMELAGLCAGCMRGWEARINELGVLTRENDLVEQASTEMGVECAGFD